MSGVGMEKFGKSGESVGRNESGVWLGVWGRVWGGEGE